MNFKKIVSHFVAALACLVVTGAVATGFSESVGFSTGVAFLLGMFGYSPAQRFMLEKLRK